MTLATVVVFLVLTVGGALVVFHSIAGRLAFTLARFSLRTFVSVLVAVLPLPASVARFLGALYGDMAVTAICANGCGQRVSLVGLVECSCGYRSVRNAFATCVACGVARRFLSCPHCGVAIRRPGWFWLDHEPRRFR